MSTDGSDYRTAPEGPPDDVVVYGPVAARTAVAIGVGFAVFFLICAIVGVFWATTVDIACRHDPSGGACVVATARPLLGESRRVIELGLVRAVKLTSVRRLPKGSMTYGVVFVTRDGAELPISDVMSLDRAARTSARDQLELFLTHRDAEPLALRYDSGEWWSLYALPLLVGAGGVVLRQWLLRTRIVFQWRGERIHVHRRRWPLRAWSRSLPMDEVERARLVEKPHTNPPEYNVALQLRSGETVPLLSRPFYFRRHHQATVDVLDALLGRVPPPPESRGA